MFKFKKLFFDFDDCAELRVESDACCFVVGQLVIEICCVAELGDRESRLCGEVGTFYSDFCFAWHVIVEAFRGFFFFRVGERGVDVSAFDVEIDRFANDVVGINKTFGRANASDYMVFEVVFGRDAVSLCYSVRCRFSNEECY